MLSFIEAQKDEDINLFDKIYLHLNKDMYFLVERECKSSGRSWDWGENEPPYFDTENRPKSVTKALNHLYFICAGFDQLDYQKYLIKLYENA